MALYFPSVPARENPPYRSKIVEGGGLRLPDDWRRVKVHLEANWRHLIAHDQSCSGELIIEIHDPTEMSEGGGEVWEGENCKMLQFGLDRQQCKELGLYLLAKALERV